MKTLILGLGNPVRTDDSVGVRVARELRVFRSPEVAVMEDSITGLDFLDVLAGYDRAIIIDAIQTRWGRAGQVYRFAPQALAPTRRTTSPQDVSLSTALELGRQLGLNLPGEIIIYGIEVADVNTVSDTCTPAVAAAIPNCVNKIAHQVKGVPAFALDIRDWET